MRFGNGLPTQRVKQNNKNNETEKLQMILINDYYKNEQMKMKKNKKFTMTAICTDIKNI